MRVRDWEKGTSVEGIKEVERKERRTKGRQVASSNKMSSYFCSVEFWGGGKQEEEEEEKSREMWVYGLFILSSKKGVKICNI